MRLVTRVLTFLSLHETEEGEAAAAQRVIDVKDGEVQIEMAEQLPTAKVPAI